MKHYKHYQPKEKGKSDFYSWNLFRWLRKQDKEKHPLLKKAKIYRSEDGALYIGSRYDEEEKIVSGFRLRALCNTGCNNKFPTVFYCIKSHKWEDVTEWFWPEYERIGVCAIHGDFAHDWETTDNGAYRICTYCDKIEKKVLTMVERIDWEAVAQQTPKLKP